MADFTAPFHAPKFSDDEFEAQKKAYVEKNGYTVTVPTFGDIIHLRAFEPLTADESTAWSARDYDKIPAGRRADIRKEKARKKAKYLAMLADPSPKIARSAAAILTALDDVQDAVSTLACIGMVAAAVIGGPVAAAVLGPLGLILGASTLLNLVNPMSHLRKLGGGIGAGRAAKKTPGEANKPQPFQQRGKIKAWTSNKGRRVPRRMETGRPITKGRLFSERDKISCRMETRRRNPERRYNLEEVPALGRKRA